MTRTLNVLCLISLLLAGSCFNPPQFDITPKIEFNNLRIKTVPGASTPDSLIVTIGFRDGDGDLGIDGTENAPPFNNRWFFLRNPSPTCENGILAPCTKISYVDTTKHNNYVTYKLRRTTPGYDTLPEFIKPYNCTRYTVIEKANLQAWDTVYSESNPLRHNFMMDLYIKSGTDFIKFDWNQFPYPNCELDGLYGRFPILAKDKNLSQELPLEGTITYKITTALLTNFANKTLRVNIRIIDRAGHISNEAVSTEFVVK